VVGALVGPLEVLLRSKDLSGGEKQTLEHLATRMERMEFPSRRAIFREGDPSGPAYVIESGVVWLTALRPDGSTHFVSEMGPGKLVGDHTCILDRPRAVTATPQTPVVAWKVCREPLVDVLRSDAGLSFSMMLEASRLVLAKDLDATIKAGSTAAARISEVLLRLHEGSTAYENGLIRVSHADLGMMVGASRESVTRTLAELRRTGAIETRRGRVVIHDVQKLQRISGRV